VKNFFFALLFEDEKVFHKDAKTPSFLYFCNWSLTNLKNHEVQEKHEAQLTIEI